MKTAITGPLSIACDVHDAGPDQFCTDHGTCCARRITRAMAVQFGAVDHEPVAVIGSKFPRKGPPS